jgi:hypothetical protein
MSAAGTGLNWKGHVHKCARTVGTACIAPLRRSRVSLERPVFIWGNGQSGTFILYDLLAASGAFFFPSTRGPRKKGLATQRYKAHDIVLDRKAVEGILLCWSGVGLPFERRDGWVFDHEMSADEAAALNAETVRARYRHLCEAWTWQDRPTRRVLDKSTNYLFMLSAIERIFPDARHIFVLRDPRLILSSILHRFKDTGYEENFLGYASGFYSDILLPGWEAQRTQPIDLRHAWQVEECIRIGRRWADRLKERCVTVFHEELCADPVRIMHQMKEFLGFAYPHGELERLVDGVAPVSEKRWPAGHRDGDAADALFIDRGSVGHLTAVGRLAVELGYDPDFCGRRAIPLLAVRGTR